LHLHAETVIKGTRSDLLLWLTNRKQPAALEAAGSAELMARWTQPRR
jgi:hypothetical protein